MSGIEIVIHVTGLCALVPNKDPFDQADELTVVLVNSRDMMDEPHYPVILVDKKFYDTKAAGNRKPDFSIAKSTTVGGSSGAEAFGFVLGAPGSVDHLEVMARKKDHSLSSLNGHKLTLSHGDKNGACPGTGSKDLAWVLDPKQRVKAGRLLGSVTGTSGKVDPSLVAALLPLTEGGLGTSGFREVNSQVVKYEYPVKSSREAIAEEVIYDFAFPDAPNPADTINSVALVSSMAAPLVLQSAGGLNITEAWLVNLPAPDIMSIRTPDPMAEDKHFTEFYRLTGDNKTDIPAPVQEFCPIQGVANPKCPPAILYA